MEDAMHLSRISRHWRCGALALLLAGCETAGHGTMTTPPNMSARLDAHDPTFRLTREQRASIEPGYDVDALERLLARLHPDLRSGTLASFQRQPANVIGGGLVKFEDPVLQALLDEVWAPRWENVPEEWFRDPDLARYPGREIAKARRAARSGNARADP